MVAQLVRTFTWIPIVLCGWGPISRIKPKDPHMIVDQIMWKHFIVCQHLRFLNLSYSPHFVQHASAPPVTESDVAKVNEVAQVRVEIWDAAQMGLQTQEIGQFSLFKDQFPGLAYKWNVFTGSYTTQYIEYDRICMGRVCHSSNNSEPTLFHLVPSGNIRVCYESHHSPSFK